MKTDAGRIFVPTVAAAGLLLLLYKRVMIALPPDGQMPFLIGAAIGFLACGIVLDRGASLLPGLGANRRLIAAVCCGLAAAGALLSLVQGVFVAVGTVLSGFCAAAAFLVVLAGGLRALPYRRRGMAFASVFFLAGLVNTTTDLAELPWLRVAGFEANMVMAAACAALACAVVLVAGAVFDTRIVAVGTGENAESATMAKLFLLAIACFVLMYVAVSLKDSVAYPVAVESVSASGFIRYVELPMWVVAGLVCDLAGRKALFAVCTLCAFVGSAGLLASAGSPASAVCVLASYFCLIGFPTACVCFVIDVSYYLSHPVYAGAFCFAPILAGVGVGFLASALTEGAGSDALFLVSVTCLALFAGLAGRMFKAAAGYRELLEQTPVLEFPGERVEGNSLEEIVERYGLTAREAEVLELVFQGKTVAQMTEELVVSKSTVKFHITNILRKTESENRKQMMEKLGIEPSAARSSAE